MIGIESEVRPPPILNCRSIDVKFEWSRIRIYYVSSRTRPGLIERNSGSSSLKPCGSRPLRFF